MAKQTKSKAPLSEQRKDSQPTESSKPIESISNQSDDEFEEFSGFESTDDETEEPAVSAEVSEKERSKIADIAKKSGSQSKDEKNSDRGVIYIGRIPHGLYEDQLREYLGQFGTITRIRISRNKKTGASKHYGFIEFASKEVAQIVCETMDNYLLFGHLVQVKLMDPKQVHPDLWVGANKKFHSIPWNQVKKRQAERKHPREWWEARQEEFDAERQAKARKLAELGIKY